MVFCSVVVPTSFDGISSFSSVPKLQVFGIVCCMVYCSDSEQYSSVCHRQNTVTFLLFAFSA